MVHFSLILECIWSCGSLCFNLVFRVKYINTLDYEQTTKKPLLNVCFVKNDAFQENEY